MLTADHPAIPDWTDIPVDDDAEPDDANVDHDLEPPHGLDPTVDDAVAADLFAAVSATQAVARIEGFVTRAQCGLRPPRSVSRNIDPARGGSKGHYGGGVQRLLTAPHSACLARLRDWQAWHMDGRGWVDLAYTGAACPHGYALAGRGFGVRTAANGSNACNGTQYAFVALLGGNERPTLPMLHALAWWVHESRRVGGAGMACGIHRDCTDTVCPGPHLPASFRHWHNRTIPTTTAPPPQPRSWLEMATEADLRRIVREELAGLPGELRRELNFTIPDGHWTTQLLGMSAGQTSSRTAIFLGWAYARLASLRTLENQARMQALEVALAEIVDADPSSTLTAAEIRSILDDAFADNVVRVRVEVDAMMQQLAGELDLE